MKPVASSRVVSDKSSGAQPDGTANAASNTVTASATPAGMLQTPDRSPAARCLRGHSMQGRTPKLTAVHTMQTMDQ